MLRFSTVAIAALAAALWFVLPLLCTVARRERQLALYRGKLRELAADRVRIHIGRRS
jgi:cytochrome c-type biogenesis protein CcmH/NrfG